MGWQRSGHCVVGRSRKRKENGKDNNNNKLQNNKQYDQHQRID